MEKLYQIDYTHKVKNIATLILFIEFYCSMIFLVILKTTLMKFMEFLSRMVYFIYLEIFVTKDLPHRIHSLFLSGMCTFMHLKMNKT